MSRKRSIKQTEDNTDINISPMIDMVFILLIFFIVTTVFVDEIGIRIDKPQPSNEPPPDDMENREPIVFNVMANGKVLYKGNSMTLNQVEKTVRDVLSRTDVPVILKVQKKALSGLMVQVVDYARNGAPDQGNFKLSVTAID